jgi:ribosomal protein S12 methylthiotransferase accessory factor
MNNKPVRLKPCKAVTPRETIIKIKKILHEKGISTLEVDTSRDNNIFYSFMVIIVENKKKVFFANGKGMDKDYALASAYGELLERLQNISFYMSTIYCSEPDVDLKTKTYNAFKYYPDERIVGCNELVDSSYNEVRHLLKLESCNKRDIAKYISKTLKLESLLSAPFYGLSSNSVKWLPINLLELITNTNGACSGNTEEEALIHGICEIMERYVLVTLYKSPFTPPDIPIELFSGTGIYNKIIRLKEKNGFEIKIKDCSLGKRLPVIGALIRDKSNENYTFHLGADPSPITALERCFTEIYQGGEIKLKPISEAITKNSSMKCRTENYDKTTRSYSGQWPILLFEEQSSYPFNGFDYFISESDKLDLEYLVYVLRQNDFDLLIRNVSYLGQPSYKVYIPGMSEITNVFGNEYLDALLMFERRLNLLYGFPKLNRSAHCKELIDGIEEIKKSSLSGDFNSPRPRYFNHLAYDESRLDLNYSSNNLLYLLNKKIGNEEAVNFYLGKIISSIYFEEPEREKFSNISDETIVKAVVGNIYFPTCFSCENCKIISKCSFDEMKNLWEVLKKISLDFDYDQAISESLSPG